MSVRNDSAFVVDARLSIYEHQSSVCPNMPVRSLIYFTAILAEFLSDKGGIRKSGKNIYGRRLVKIPTPHFVVFYNGEEEQPEVQELRLSDAFEKKTDDLLLDIETAIDYCVEHDILKEFLKTHRNEVVKNMQLDYTFDRQLELERADAREEGWQEGRQEERKLLVNTVKRLRNGESPEQLIAEGVDRDTLKIAQSIQ